VQILADYRTDWLLDRWATSGRAGYSVLVLAIAHTGQIVTSHEVKLEIGRRLRFLGHLPKNRKLTSKDWEDAKQAWLKQMADQHLN
jgi:hypothetical protein